MFVFTHCFVIFDANFRKIRTKYGQNTKNYERIRANTNKTARRVRKIEMRVYEEHFTSPLDLKNNLHVINNYQ